MPDHPVVASLLRSIDEAYDRRSWHGTNLRGSLRGLDARRASWRPARGRHNVWEIVLHAAYWKYVVRRRLTREKRGSFSLRGSNWFSSPAGPTEAAWKEALALLATVTNTERLARGIAAHDLYHAGQIQLLKRLMPARRRA